MEVPPQLWDEVTESESEKITVCEVLRFVGTDPDIESDLLDDGDLLDGLIGERGTQLNLQIDQLNFTSVVLSCELQLKLGFY